MDSSSDLVSKHDVDEVEVKLNLAMIRHTGYAFNKLIRSVPDQVNSISHPFISTGEMSGCLGLQDQIKHSIMHD